MIHLISILIWFSVNCLTYTLWQYCKDGYKIQDEGKFLYVMPSVRDLSEGASIYIIDKYVNEVICPSYGFFIIRNTLRREDSYDYIAGWILQAASFLCMCRAVFHYANQFDLTSATKTIVLIAILVGFIAILAFVYWIIRKVYTSRYSLPIFDMGRDELFERYNRRDEAFPIDKDRGFQNFVILAHYNYLLKVQKAATRRLVIYEVLGEIAAIIYFLFFFRVPE